ncbi:hypothetical protein ACFL6C_11770, partial [Myxococcota bacterium]
MDELFVNAWCQPEVLNCHLWDEVTQLSINFGPTVLGTRALPSPEEPNPEESVPAIEARSPPFSLKHSQLMAKSNHFDRCVTSRSQERECTCKQASEDGEHRQVLCQPERQSSMILVRTVY